MNLVFKHRNKDSASDVKNGDISESSSPEPKAAYNPKPAFPPSVYGDTMERWLFVLVTAIVGSISTISVPIYFPAIDLLADKFNTSVDNINVTATVYSVFQGVSPIFWAAWSDTWGRRPVYFCCIAINFAANVALACCNSYGQLLGLRILQAFGGASTVSLIGGTIGDYSTRKNRGALVGVAMGVSMLGNCFGPLIGGGLQKQFDSWRAIFWGLAVWAGFSMMLVFFFLPETNRHIVGNGCRAPPNKPVNWLSWSPYILVRRKITGYPKLTSDPTWRDEWCWPAGKVQWFRWVHLFFKPQVLLILVPTAIHYTTWYMVLTAQSTLLSSNYNMDALQVSYTYLSSGMGTFFCSVVTGQIMQYGYKRQLRYTPVNIYKARLGYSFYASGLQVITTLVFAWTLHFNVSFYAPVVMTFFISIGASYFLSVSSAIMVDLFPEDSAASQSCNNLARCCLCACGLAAVQSMMDHMTIGGTFTFMAGLCFLSSLMLWYLIVHYGPKNCQLRVTEGDGEDEDDSLDGNEQDLDSEKTEKRDSEYVQSKA